MTAIQQQRLVGARLLLLIMISIALFLINQATSDDVEPQPEIVPSTILIDDTSEGDIEIIDYHAEVLLDPHNINQQETVEVDMADKIELSETVAQNDNNPAVSTIKPTAEVTTELWVLQVASFTVKDNASSLQNKVNALGYQAKLEQIQTDTRTVYRVRIGPEKDKAILEKVAVDLKKQLKLSPQILLQIP